MNQQLISDKSLNFFDVDGRNYKCLISPLQPLTINSVVSDNNIHL